MKILYVSCHEVLEFDEISMLSEMGYRVFSLGAYLDPARPCGQGLRPSLPSLRRDPGDLQAYNDQNPADLPEGCSLTSQFINRFDAVIVMHKPEWIERNWHVLRELPTIWRTIGQSGEAIERRMQTLRISGLKIARYSPRERLLPAYCGEDAVIRFAKPLRNIPPWTGNCRRVVNFTKGLSVRRRHCNYDLFREVTSPFKCDVFGADNEDIPELARGSVTAEEQRHILSDRRVYFYTGTYPACYTLAFIEAWLAGIPIVAVGPMLWQTGAGYGGELYEIPDLIQNGVNGFIGESIEELQGYIRQLLDDGELAGRISLAARESASRIFDPSHVRQQWVDFLDAHARPANRHQRYASPTVPPASDAFFSRSSWLDRCYRSKLDGRFATMKLALNLFLQRGGSTIVETGCIRLQNDFGAGCSTVIFCEFLQRYGGCMFSVDIDPDHVDLAERLTAFCPAVRELIIDDSIRFLESGIQTHPRFPGTIGLLYLDSLDYPLDLLLETCDRGELDRLDDETIAELYPELVLPAQQHCLAELRAAYRFLNEKTIVLIDDNDLPGGGKSRLAKKQLIQWNWTCLLDLQQTVWVRQ